MSLFGTTGALVVALVVLVLLVVAITAAVLVARARRLDRLHVRTDAAAAGLVAALDRRAAVVRATVAAPTVADRRALRDAAHAAEAAGGGPAREAAENDLARRLSALDTATLPRELAAELLDAHTRVAVARRVHNDAVRDTRALRSRRMVRYLRLAGTAPVPHYFEIAESFEIAEPLGPPDVEPGSTDDDPLAGEAGVVGAVAPEAAGEEEPARSRDAARVIVVDPADRVLLLEGADPERPTETFWFAPGGGVEPGEVGRDAAARSVAVLGVCSEQLTGPLWVRSVMFAHDGVTYVGQEVFFLLRLSETTATARAGDLDEAALGETAGRQVRGHRWWTLSELATTVDVVYPHQLARLLADPAARLVTDPPLAIH